MQQTEATDSIKPAVAVHHTPVVPIASPPRVRTLWMAVGGLMNAISVLAFGGIVVGALGPDRVVYLEKVAQELPMSVAALLFMIGAALRRIDLHRRRNLFIAALMLQIAHFAVDKTSTQWTAVAAMVTAATIWEMSKPR